MRGRTPTTPFSCTPPTGGGQGTERTGSGVDWCGLQEEDVDEVDPNVVVVEEPSLWTPWERKSGRVGEGVGT